MYSIQTAVSDGTLTMLALSIEYPRRDYIHVYFDGVEQTEGDTWNWVGVSDKAITFSQAVPDGVVVRVQRITPLDTVPNIFGSATPPYVGYAEFDADTVDENFRQTLQVAQESVDRTDAAIQSAADANDTAAVAVGIAEGAVTIANSAVVTAEGAVDTADEALDIATGIDAKAQQALDDSAEAVNTANAIAGVANSALQVANDATDTANTAITTANTAESTANGIAGMANTALFTANNAELIASGAADDAALALSAANAIAGTANDALDLAEAADSTATAAAIAVATAAQKSANLSDLTNAETARANIGLGNDAAGRANLGLGSAATRNVGTGANEVPANSNLGSAATRNVGTGPDQVPTNSDLGTAATRDVTTSPTDVTDGRVLKVGDFGLGGILINPNLENKSYLANFQPGKLPVNYPAGEYPYGAMLSIAHGYSGSNTEIVFTHVHDSKILYRYSKDAPWREIYHSGNLSKNVKYWSGIVESGGIGTANVAPGTVDFGDNTVLTGLRTAGSGNWYSIYARGRTLTL